MKKIRTTIALIITVLLITSCTTGEKVKVNETTTLKGTISTSEVTIDNETKKISVLNLDEPIIIDGTSVNKIERDYDKDLKDDGETSITGTIKSNDNGDANTKYSLAVDDIENTFSYINKFSNDKFSLTIPADLMKIVTIKKEDDSIIIYSSNNMDSGGEACRFVALDTASFKKLNSEKGSYEKVKSNTNMTIIVVYPTGNQYNEKNFNEYEQIMNSLGAIKNSVRIK